MKQARRRGESDFVDDLVVGAPTGARLRASGELVTRALRTRVKSPLDDDLHRLEGLVDNRG